MTLVIAAIGILVGLDGFLSWRRMRKYGPSAELNPVAREICEEFGPGNATGFILLTNAAIVGVSWAAGWENILWLLLGAKLALCAAQLKSLQLEMFIEKLLAGTKKD